MGKQHRAGVRLNVVIKFDYSCVMRAVRTLVAERVKRSTELLHGDCGESCMCQTSQLVTRCPSTQCSKKNELNIYKYLMEMRYLFIIQSHLNHCVNPHPPQTFTYHRCDAFQVLNLFQTGSTLCINSHWDFLASELSICQDIHSPVAQGDQDQWVLSSVSRSSVYLAESWQKLNVICTIIQVISL